MKSTVDISGERNIKMNTRLTRSRSTRKDFCFSGSNFMQLYIRTGAIIK